jgi:drug/metabolite transporter (DMT)-like permease
MASAGRVSRKIAPMSDIRSAQHNLTGALWMLTAGLSFAAVNSLSQYVSAYLGLHSTVVAFWEYFVSFVVMLPWIISSGIASAFRTERLGLHVVRVAFSVIGIQFWLWAMAVPVPIWQAIALLMTSPLMATAGSALFLGEKVGPSRWLATLVGFAGAMIILQPWSDDFRLTSLLPLAAAFFWAGYSVLVKYMSHTESPATIVLYLLLLIAPFNFFLALPNFETPTRAMWLVLITAGVLVALAQWAIAKAYENAEASFVQPFDLVKLLWNVAAGWLVFHQVPPGKLWLGAALIIGASLYLMLQEKKKA